MQKNEILKQYFGYATFREGQEELIDSTLAGRDTIGIMPTGAGKSLCFQIPALLLTGLTLVISPLISLMKDQVQALGANGVPAAYINSSLNNNQIIKVIENAKDGKYKMIYVAPERLDMAEFIGFCQKADIALLTVDEAHCISQWGQNFRPSYLKIREFIDKLPKKPTISAFTATATDEVKEDIIRILKLTDPFVVSTGFDRENLYFEVKKPANKDEALLDYLKKNPGKSGIVYCATRKAVEEVCTHLTRAHYETTRYHAGLSEDERNKNQDDFLYDRKAIMVATNAFGMGIDKSNVSFVIHYNMPKSIESYYQEAGRAGRDGAPADCILLYGGQDVITNQFLIDNSNDNSDLDPMNLELVRIKDRERLKQMTYYCHSYDCLREYILNYFGDNTANYCDNCYNCNTNFEELDITEYAQKILSCIKRMDERYGIKVIIDTLRGSKGERILRMGLDSIKTYGIMSEVSEKRIREVINYLVLNDYLMLTNSEFPTVKLTLKSRDVLFNDEKLMMKVAGDQPIIKMKKERGLKKHYAKSEGAVNDGLFNQLKELRLRLAQDKKVPAFVIFSDSALLDMCDRMPSTGAEFLEVSGVGKMKLEQYGKAFLEVIGSFSHRRIK